MYSRKNSPAQEANRQRLLAESAARMAAFREQEAQAKAAQAAREKEHEELVAKSQARREAFARGETVNPGNSLEVLSAHYGEKRAEEVKAAEAEEAARRAALTPLDIWKSTLSYQERKRVEAWEAVNGMPWPLELAQK